MLRSASYARPLLKEAIKKNHKALSSNGVIHIQNTRLFNTLRLLNNIDDFNRRKTTYSFGVDLEDTKYSDANEAERFPDIDGLNKSSAEYKEKLSALRSQEEEELRKLFKKEETRERIKAMLIGILALVSIGTAHNIITHYDYYRAWALHSWNYGELDDSKHVDVSDPKLNKNKKTNLVTSITEGVDDDAFAAMKPFNSTPGLYLFGGEYSKAKVPLRIPFFDDILIKDVQLKDGIASVLTEKNELFQIDLKKKKNDKSLPVPIKSAKLPCKTVLTRITNNYIYLLGSNGNVYYTKRFDAGKGTECKGYQYRNLLGVKSTSKDFGIVQFSDLKSGEKVTDVSAGENHLLFLTSAGRLFTAASADGLNFGQFGIPKYYPSDHRYDLVQKGTVKASKKELIPETTLIPLNIASPLVGLNNEIVRGANGASLRPRYFTNIAAGLYHNVVSDSSGNIWSWGRNAYGECGSEVSYKTDTQNIPQIVISSSDFYRATNHILKTSKIQSDWAVEGIYTGDECTFLKTKYKNDQDILFSFGNGMKGQLANNWYLQVCLTPQAVKSLLSLSQFDETKNEIVSVGIRDISLGKEHGFITLDANDVLAFGDNEFGQLGTGKLARSSKPIQMPRVIEPEETQVPNARNKIASRIQDSNERLQAIQVDKWEQKIVAGDNLSAIYYKKIN